MGENSEILMASSIRIGFITKVSQDFPHDSFQILFVDKAFGDPYKCSQLQQVCAEGSIARILWDSLQNICFVKLNRNVTGTSNCCHDYACFMDLYIQQITNQIGVNLWQCKESISRYAHTEDFVSESPVMDMQLPGKDLPCKPP